MLEPLREMETKSGAKVEGVLWLVSTVYGRMDHKLTIIAWTPEFTSTNIQMGGDMYLIPAHIHIIAPAWWYVCRKLLFLPFARMMSVSNTS